jgi:hypothetical protein
MATKATKDSLPERKVRAQGADRLLRIFTGSKTDPQARFTKGMEFPVTYKDRKKRNGLEAATVKKLGALHLKEVVLCVELLRCGLPQKGKNHGTLLQARLHLFLTGERIRGR